MSDERFKKPTIPQFDSAAPGLQIAKVIALEGDPNNEYRIQIEKTVRRVQVKSWARLANLDAGENRGMVFRPEVGDEVIVGFIDNDPNEPIILGSLHNAPAPPPIEVSEDNPVKGLVTRGGIRLLFDDDETTITMDTPNGNRIIISEEEESIIIEDQHTNKILMDQDGIKLDSHKNIVLDANHDISIKAKSNIFIDGLNITADADAQFKATGNAGAEMTSSAIAVVKGSLVKIN